MQKIVIVYLNLYEVSSLQNTEKKLTNSKYLKKTMQEARRKPEGLIAWHFRHFAFLRVFYSSEGESKTSATYEMELFVALANATVT